MTEKHGCGHFSALMRRTWHTEGGNSPATDAVPVVLGKILSIKLPQGSGVVQLIFARWFGVDRERPLLVEIVFWGN